MINIVDEKWQECCGCSACEQICPQDCIQMQEDKEGFLYPIVDREKCVECNLCEKVCPILQKEKYYREGEIVKEAIGGWHKDEEVRKKSSSGGAFTLFAVYILEQKGIVYGCALNEQNQAVHISIQSKDELDKLRGSKYIQSDINGVYIDIKKQLEDGRKVLFVGTPCQAAGLHSFLMGREWDNLYVCDFICHGVPSPKVFRSYIELLREKYDTKIVSFKFRHKDVERVSSTMQMGTKIEFEKYGVKYFSPAYKDVFMSGFSTDLYLRPSCYECEFKVLPKYYSDITIADFWGVKKVDIELDDGKGTSLLFLNSEKGEVLFDKVKNNFYFKKCQFEKAISRNKSLTKSASLSRNREQFFEDYLALPFEKVTQKHMNVFKWGVHKVMYLSGIILENIVKRIMKPIFKLFCIDWSEEYLTTFIQFIKFALVGMSNFAVSYTINASVLFLLSGFGWMFDYVIANISGFVLSVLWSFTLNNRFVFTLKKGEQRSKGKTLLKTYMAYAFTGIVVNNALSTIWIHVLGISKFMAPFLNLPVSVPINFVMNKLWAYRVRNKKK